MLNLYFFDSPLSFEKRISSNFVQRDYQNALQKAQKYYQKVFFCKNILGETTINPDAKSLIANHSATAMLFKVITCQEQECLDFFHFYDYRKMSFLIAALAKKFRYYHIPSDICSISYTNPNFCSYFILGIYAFSGDTMPVVVSAKEHLLSHLSELNEVWLLAFFFTYWKNIAHARAAQEILRFISLNKTKHWAKTADFINFLAEFTNLDDDLIIQKMIYEIAAEDLETAKLIQVALEKIRNKPHKIKEW